MTIDASSDTTSSVEKKAAAGVLLDGAIVGVLAVFAPVSRGR